MLIEWWIFEGYLGYFLGYVILKIQVKIYFIQKN